MDQGEAEKRKAAALDAVFAGSRGLSMADTLEYLLDLNAAISTLYLQLLRANNGGVIG